MAKESRPFASAFIESFGQLLLFGIGQDPFWQVVLAHIVANADDTVAGPQIDVGEDACANVFSGGIPAACVGESKTEAIGNIMKMAKNETEYLIRKV